MVLTPSLQTFSDMMRQFPKLKTHDCGDQGFLNRYFKEWRNLPAEHHLPLSFNAHVRLFTTYPRFKSKKFVESIKPVIVHYSGMYKPWEERDLTFGGVDYREVFKELI